MTRTNTACLVTPQNVDRIISHARDYDLNLDYLKDNLEYFAEDGIELYVVQSSNDETGNTTFTEMSKDGLLDYWQFVHPENIAVPWFQLIRKL